jgi:Methyltransferase domain
MDWAVQRSLMKWFHRKVSAVARGNPPPAMLTALVFECSFNRIEQIYTVVERSAPRRSLSPSQRVIRPAFRGRLPVRIRSWSGENPSNGKGASKIALFGGSLGPSVRSDCPRLTFRKVPILLKTSPVFGNLWTLGLRVAFGARKRRGYDVVLGRNGQRALHCSDEDELRFLVTCTYCSLVLLPSLEIGQNIEHLLSLYRHVRERLETRFSADQIRRGSTGGWPGMKEAVLHALVRRYHPQDVVETGVAQGISTTFILDALQQNGTGHLTSVDLPNVDPSGYSYENGTRDPVFVKAALEVGWLVPEALRSRWTLLIGPSEDVLPTLSIQPQLFVHDSKHTYEHMTLEFEWAWSRLPNGGILVSDDISWNSAYSDFLAAHKSDVVPICTEGVGIALRGQANARTSA